MNNIIEKLIRNYPVLEKNIPEIVSAYENIIQCYNAGGKLLLCGNGGSASDCEHIVGELLKGFTMKRKLPDTLKAEFIKHGADEKFTDCLQGSLPAIALVNQSAFSTAFLNDVDPQFIFAQQVYGLGKQEDVLLGISTSGNSQNVINAAIVARQKKMKVIGLTGRNGGNLEKFCDIAIKAPAEETYRIQEYHLPIYHTLCEMVEHYFWEG